MVLALDDEAAWRRAIQGALSAEFRVHTVSDSREFWEQLHKRRPDIALIDWWLDAENANAKSLVEKLHHESPDIPFVIVTIGNLQEGEFDWLDDHGCSGYFDKERGLETLSPVVRELPESISVGVNLAREEHQRRAKERSKYPLIGESPAMEELRAKISRAAVSEMVLILGETGVGKGVVARHIHDNANNPRSRGPFEEVACTDVRDEFLQSELFGHLAGAFTGAVRNKKGAITIAKGGSLFLDEVGDMSRALQRALLRILEEKTYKPMGDVRYSKADVHVIAATNKDLKKLVEREEFRMDLYWRLNGFPVRVPPLRERKGDIELLVNHFREIWAEELGRVLEEFADEELDAMREHEWPGNVRELKYAVFRRCAAGNTWPITLSNLEAFVPRIDAAEDQWYLRKLDDVKNEQIELTVEHFGGNLTKAAKVLGCSRRTLEKRRTRDQGGG